MMHLPTDAKARKNAPMARGLLDYFPLACAAVAELSRIGNEQHNPGQEMHWAREKSTDHADCIVRHLVDRGTVDTDGVRHATKVAWRALAMLQLELEAEAAQPMTHDGDVSDTVKIGATHCFRVESVAGDDEHAVVSPGPIVAPPFPDEDRG